jgi:hypothetical protein
MAELTAEQDKKAKKAFFKAAGITGIGFGLFLLSIIGPFIYSGEETLAMQAMFFKYGVMVMLYTASMVGVFMFMRKWMVPTNIFMQWVYLPTLAIMFAMEAYEILIK